MNFSNDVQSSKAFIPIKVTDDGIVISFKEVHPLKAFHSIVTTEDGIITSFNEVHPEKRS